VLVPAELLRIVREHWGIGIFLHWVVAVARDEDRQRTGRCGRRADRRPPCYRIEGLPRSTRTGKF